MRATRQSGSSLGPMCVGFALAVALHVVGYLAWQRYGATPPPPIKIVNVPSPTRTVARVAPPTRVPLAAQRPRAVVRQAPLETTIASAPSVVVARPAAAQARSAPVASRSAPQRVVVAAQTSQEGAMQVPQTCITPQVPTVSYPEWNNFQKLGIPEPCAAVKTRAASARAWSEVLAVLEMKEADVYARPLVEPYCLGQRNPNLAEFGSLKGKTGVVTLSCSLTASGHPTVTVVPSGDAVLDKVAYRLGSDTMWLPALRNGQPVDYRFEYVMVFAACEYH